LPVSAKMVPRPLSRLRPTEGDITPRALRAVPAPHSRLYRPFPPGGCGLAAWPPPVPVARGRSQTLTAFSRSMRAETACRSSVSPAHAHSTLSLRVALYVATGWPAARCPRSEFPFLRGRGPDAGPPIRVKHRARGGSGVWLCQGWRTGCPFARSQTLQPCLGRRGARRPRSRPPWASNRRTSVYHGRCGPLARWRNRFPPPVAGARPLSAPAVRTLESHRGGRPSRWHPPQCLRDWALQWVEDRPCPGRESPYLELFPSLRRA